MLLLELLEYDNCMDGWALRMVAELKPAVNRSLVVVLKGQYWGQPCFMALLMIWMRRFSAPSVNLQRITSWKGVLICLKLGRPSGKIRTSWINCLRPVV